MNKSDTTKTFDETLPNINTRYAYVLAQENEVRGKVYDENGNKREEVKYKPCLNLLTKSSIVWPGGKDPFSGKERAKGRHQIRYYDGCTTLFVDDQPREKDIIDQLLSASRELTFDFGYLFVYGYDSLLKLYMDWCSYNEESPYRIPNFKAIFKSVNTEKESKKEAGLLEIEDEARELAKKAEFKKMRIHAKYLGVPDTDNITMQPLTETAIRVEYRKAAKANPINFIKSYNDKTIEISTWAKEALNTGQISTNIIPNQAVWAKGNTVICSIDGLKAQDLIVEKLVEFSQTEDGGDFLAQLKVLYN
jgi:hypothetical protein